MTLSVSGTSKKFCLILAALIVTGTGCQTMLQSPSALSTPMAASNTSGDSQTYTVEQSSNWSNPTTTREPFSGPVPLQKILEKSGATRRYGNLDITVVRVSKNTGQLVQMKAKYDPKRRAIEPNYDYDILANDHVIIKPSNSSPIDDMFKPFKKLVDVSGN
ncbi:MAG: hypothetical protein Q8M16_23395 [Pirellulaceae bacterium]|nr:hypothetical protein [Pirellulaceae bacterium]